MIERLEIAGICCVCGEIVSHDQAFECDDCGEISHKNTCLHWGFLDTDICLDCADVHSNNKGN